ncbi:MAG: mechanosensitive ion channel family protein [Lysobacterales bacterium]
MSRLRTVLRQLRSRLAVGVFLRVLLALVALSVGATAGAEPAPAAEDGVELVMGGRPLHVFRAPLGALSAEERAELAERHVREALEKGGAGWTSVLPLAEGVAVQLDEANLFVVLPGDARSERGETAHALANRSARVLQQIAAEHREHRDPRLNLLALGKLAVALLLLTLALAVLLKLSRMLQRRLGERLSQQMQQLLPGAVRPHLQSLLVTLAVRVSVVLVWLLALAALVAFLAYALGLFALTRPAAERLVDSLLGSLGQAMAASAAALPGLFVALMIFLLARLLTQVTRSLFDRINEGSVQLGALDAHTAPATRGLINLGIWLFALAMAYPYLPGSQTEAFKGLSVLLGLMVSIGASGLVGQIAAGLILVFTRALRVGEYVRIQEHEGTVTEIGLCLTRLKNGKGEEIALPNSLVIGQVTRNLSRHAASAGGSVLETGVTIGYDTPWRQVHALLQSAAAEVPDLLRDPAPYVIQTALSDFYVEYRLVAQLDGSSALPRAQVLSQLHAAILDAFNTHGVQIMSPHYEGDPAQAKWVPRAQWHASPAPGEER